MDISARKNLSITIGVIVFVIILMLALWLCVVATDYIRYRTNSIPIFAYNVSILDNEEGYVEKYKGIGYKYICNLNNNNPNEFYILGIKAP